MASKYLSSGNAPSSMGSILTQAVSQRTGGTYTSSSGQTFVAGQPVSVSPSGRIGVSGVSYSGGSSGVSSAPAPAPVFTSTLTGQSFSSAADRDKAETAFKAEQARQAEAVKNAALQRDAQIGVRGVGDPPGGQSGVAEAGAVTAKLIVESEQPTNQPASFSTLEETRQRQGQKIQDKVQKIGQYVAYDICNSKRGCFIRK